jgi:hypothetical protein
VKDLALHPHCGGEAGKSSTDRRELSADQLYRPAHSVLSREVLQMISMGDEGCGYDLETHHERLEREVARRKAEEQLRAKQGGN